MLFQTPSRSSEPLDTEIHVPEAMKIIHKEQDGITAFCLNQVNIYISYSKKTLKIYLSHHFLSIPPMEVHFFCHIMQLG